jgi:enoyl-CoA hydratase/carnithine racemase
MQDYTTIDVQRDGAVDWLTLNRPDRLNAIDDTMNREL